MTRHIIGSREDLRKMLKSGILAYLRNFKLPKNMKVIRHTEKVVDGVTGTTTEYTITHSR